MFGVVECGVENKKSGKKTKERAEETRE